MPNEESLIALKKQRAVLQGSCTQIKTFVDSLATTSITPSLVAQLKERRARLDVFWSDYEFLQTKIELEDENEGNHRVNFEESFYALSGHIRELLNSAKYSHTPSPTTSRVSEISELLMKVRLPKLNLPTFSGNYNKWFPFFDTFHSLIHSNASLDDIKKLQYLRASLTGDAKNIVSALEISALNYQVTWQLLKDRYDNRRVIAQNHIKAIMELPSMLRENAAELRQIADGATKHIHTLQAFKRPTSHWDDLLIFLVVSLILLRCVNGKIL